MTSQETILLKFVQGEDGIEWARKMYGWSKTDPESYNIDVCDWTGVDCHDDDNPNAVTSVNLSQTNLIGTIPPELSLLTTLKKLDLSRNILMGPIPPEVARLPNLEEVILAKNQLSGPLPKFVSLELRMLDVENNKLSENLPDGFGESHPKMVNLNVVGNSLTGTIPETISHMENLVWLQLSENNFYGTIPSSLGKLYNLQFLYLDHNLLMGEIPRELTPVSSRLTEVWFHRNMLTGTIPAAFAELKELKNLYVDGNKFIGTLPNDLCRPQINEDFFEDEVKEEDRNYCQSIACPAGTSSPEGVWPCDTCKENEERNPYLGLEGECFSTQPWSILRKFMLNLEDESATSLGTTWTNLDPNTNVCQLDGITCNDSGDVTRIELQERNLMGMIAPEIGFLEHLEVLNLSNNMFRGFLPSDLMFAPLTQLDVTNNELMGIVPPALCETRINNNGMDGTFDCNIIACPVGTYSNTGRANDRMCLPCDDGRPFLGKTNCGETTQVNNSTTKTDGVSNAVAFVAFFLGLAGFGMIVVGALFYLKRKQSIHSKFALASNSDPGDLSELDLDYQVALANAERENALGMVDSHHDDEYAIDGRGVSAITGGNKDDELFPNTVDIEEMDDDDYSSITRIKKRHHKKKKKKKHGSSSSSSSKRRGDGHGDYDSVSAGAGSSTVDVGDYDEEDGSATGGGGGTTTHYSIDEDDTTNNPVWLDVPKLEPHESGTSTGASGSGMI